MSRKNDRTLREDFEAFLPTINAKVNLLHAADGGYQHLGTEIAWAAYNRAYNLSPKNLVRNEHTLDMRKHSFVVGTLTNGWAPSFSPHPHVHKKFELAKAEAQRLANLANKEFCVVAVVKGVKPQTPEEIVEEKEKLLNVGESIDTIPTSPFGS